MKARFHREPVTWGGGSFERFRVDVVDVLKRRWHLLTLATLAGSLSVFAGPAGLVAGAPGPVRRGERRGGVRRLVAGRILGSIPITPGGIGIVELSLTAALIGFGGNNAGVVAAVLVFRFLTIVPTLVLGTVAAGCWRRVVAGALETRDAVP